MTKLVEWSTPSEKDIAVYYEYLLKNGFIKKPKPLENVAHLYCKICGDTVHSKWSGDYVSCKCGRAAIDQTHEYTRLIGEKCDYEIKQEEEKFGELRVYWSVEDWDIRETADKLVAEAEESCSKCCVVCGEEGRVMVDEHGHYGVLCEKHRKEEGK